MLLKNKRGKITQDNHGYALESVRAKLLQKAPKFLIVISDACNVMLNIDEPELSFRLDKLTPIPKGSGQKKLSTLFDSWRGSIVLIGSVPGKKGTNCEGFSMGSPKYGGKMSYCFFGAFRYELMRFGVVPSRETILKNTKNSLLKSSKGKQILFYEIYQDN